jgi:hypothetical protein
MLPTSGGGTIVVTGRNLGLEPGVVELEYAGGSAGMVRRTYLVRAGGCALGSPGTELRCGSLEGVGANYTFRVSVHGGSSVASADTLSHSPPTITSIDGEAAVQGSAGGTTVVLHGSNLGPAANTAVTVWASPVGRDGIMFPATNCAVAVPHVTVVCVVGEAVGAALSWRVVVEGQSNSMPVSRVAAPVISSVTLEGTALGRASTLGGAALVVDGDNFGGRGSAQRDLPLSSSPPPPPPMGRRETFCVRAPLHVSVFAPACACIVYCCPRLAGRTAVYDQADGRSPLAGVEVTLLAPAGVLTAGNCTVAVPHRRLRCVMPAGVGVVSAVTVSVLGQATTAPTAGIAYEAPVVAALTPPMWGTDLSVLAVSVAGYGFGPSAGPAGGVVAADVTGTATCGARVTFSAVATVRDDGSAVFDVRQASVGLVRNWTVILVVAGQASQVGHVVGVRVVVAPDRGFASIPNPWLV